MRFTITFCIIILLCSCSSLNSKEATAVYGRIPDKASVYIEEIRLSPDYRFDGIAEELPDYIRCCLLNCGCSTVPEPSPESVSMKVFIHSRNWRHNFRMRESVTVSIKLTSAAGASAYRIFTTDTDRSIDSLQWILKIIEKNIRVLKEAAENEA